MNIKAADRYKKLEQGRQATLERARKMSALTLPWLLPPDGADADTELKDPYQNTGSRGVNNLAAKLSLAIMPPNEPFFRHDPDPMAAAALEEQEPGTIKEARKKLAKYDRSVMRRIEASGDRPKMDLIAKHLLVAGNVLVDLRGATARVISMDHYVVRRDPQGTVVELVIQEKVHPDALDDKTRAAVEKGMSETDVNKPSGDKEPLELFTHVSLIKGMYEVFQEVGGTRVPGSEGKYKPDRLPFIALRFVVVDGQSYGRSFVESMAGDLETLEVLTQAVTDVASMASKVIFLVRQNGMTRVKDLQDATSGDFVSGDANDVTVLRLDKGADLQIAWKLAEELKVDLSEDMLLRGSVTRDAERVTAEEIRYVALELEDALSGIYSLLTYEFQVPYVRLKVAGMKDLPKLDSGDTIQMTIVTGLEALRRGHELQKLRIFIAEMVKLYGPQAAAQFIPPESFAARLADALGLEILDLVTDAETATTNTLTNTAASALGNAAPEVIKGALTNG